MLFVPVFDPLHALNLQSELRNTTMITETTTMATTTSTMATTGMTTNMQQTTPSMLTAAPMNTSKGIPSGPLNRAYTAVLIDCWLMLEDTNTPYVLCRAIHHLYYEDCYAKMNTRSPNWCLVVTTCNVDEFTNQAKRFQCVSS